MLKLLPLLLLTPTAHAGQLLPVKAKDEQALFGQICDGGADEAEAKKSLPPEPKKYELRYLFDGAGFRLDDESKKAFDELKTYLPERHLGKTNGG
jgi:hypothetical protein